MRLRLPRIFFPTPTLRRIGLTGGIGAGKSAAATRFRQLGIPVIDIDPLAKAVLQNDPKVRAQVAQVVGFPIPELSIEVRKQLREALFASAPLRRAVERILHPPAIEAFDRACAALPPQTRLVICEAALLIESGHYRAMDALVVVYAPEPVRRERLIRRDGITPELADSILKTQTDDRRRVAAADRILDNSSGLESLHSQIDLLIAEWRQKDWMD